MKAVTASSRKQQIRQAIAIAANRAGHALASDLTHRTADGEAMLIIEGPDIQTVLGEHLRNGRVVVGTIECLPTIEAIEAAIWHLIKRMRNRMWETAVVK